MDLTCSPCSVVLQYPCRSLILLLGVEGREVAHRTQYAFQVFSFILVNALLYPSVHI